ncbi:type II toxin-antitoxin system RelE/ParE family toxin [Providencia zhijiangensis]|uniref:Type II toxin-antitoxin system RelE/ParE family toxin n=1 Tax=Providencia zhijiangensis TaxID=3053982 RepID=A0ABZ0N5J4_9GAMM|nr:type II toxin-antitoxin system RelE/ParE family toxin [Providencia sp. D4759]WPA92774.1 type II toxin-antitoxin system RelE/ParE family toxin [Providencia sp. D4759]
MNYLEFVETTVFSKRRRLLMDDTEFQSFQTFLLENYALGDTISHTGGCKKIRWNRTGMGKSGGLRIIYYVRAMNGRIYLLLIYPKNEQDDLSEQQKSILRTLSKQFS